MTTHIIRFGYSLLIVLAAALAGCGSAPEEDRDFFTSGSREADQRAEQRMAKDAQLTGGEEAKASAGEEGVGGAAKAPQQQTLYDRLGGEAGIAAIVDDFVARALADPRVNWSRKGIDRGGFSLYAGQSMEWDANPANVAKLKKHIAQFLAVATSGPPVYEGRDMKQAHADMHITNAEFDASVGDLKATLDKLQVPDQEQKELLAVVESTRAQVVEER